MAKTLIRTKDQAIITQRLIVIVSLLIMIGLFMSSSKGADSKGHAYSTTTTRSK